MPMRANLPLRAIGSRRRRGSQCVRTCCCLRAASWRTCHRQSRRRNDPTKPKPLPACGRRGTGSSGQRAAVRVPGQGADAGEAEERRGGLPLVGHPADRLRSGQAAAAAAAAPTTATGTTPGAGARGAARGAVVGEVVGDDAGTGAAVGAAAARGQSRRQNERRSQQQQSSATQQQQAGLREGARSVPGRQGLHRQMRPTLATKPGRALRGATLAVALAAALFTTLAASSAFAQALPGAGAGRDADRRRRADARGARKARRPHRAVSGRPGRAHPAGVDQSAADRPGRSLSRQAQGRPEGCRSTTSGTTPSSRCSTIPRS